MTNGQVCKWLMTAALSVNFLNQLQYLRSLQKTVDTCCMVVNWFYNIQPFGGTSCGVKNMLYNTL